MTPPDSIADLWQTPAEITHFRETATVEQVEDYLARLNAHSDAISVSTFGHSAEGRALTVAIVARGVEHTATAARASGRPIIMLQAGIHPGENEGKDAILVLLRQLLVAEVSSPWLDELILIVVPVYNVDGEARRSPFNRINQLGPETMGWRTNASNLNLNRDFIKADTAEMRAWLSLWADWMPHLMVDMHNTDGADFQYDSSWILAAGPNVPAALAQWQQTALIDGAFAVVEGQGFKLAPYIQLVEDDDPRKGITGFIATPRYSTGYVLAHARPGLTIENHMLKTNERRFDVSLALLRAILDEVAAHPAALTSAISSAEAQARAQLAAPEGYPLELRISTIERRMRFLGVGFTRQLSEISGRPWIRYQPETAQVLDLAVFDQTEAAAVGHLPAAWLIPVEWQEVIARLRAHRIEISRLNRSLSIDAEFDRAEQIALSAKSFEGRQMVESWTLVQVRRQRDFAAGSVLVEADQALAVLAAEMLQPGAPDSLARWGFFNAVFEDKEYFEARVMEELARKMLAERPELRDAFELALMQATFAGDRDARLRWFYERSEWADPRRNVIPIARLDAATSAELRCHLAPS